VRPVVLVASVTNTAQGARGASQPEVALPRGAREEVI
jgi:hypothetical protein